MTDLNEGIVEQYADHLLRKASSVIVTFAVGGAIGGAAMGTVPALLSHSVISPGANYFAVLLGAIAGGFLGRSIGERRAVGLRLQAQMALHQIQIESRLVAPLAAQAARPAAPAPAPAVAAVQVAPLPAVSAPVAPPPAAPAPLGPVRVAAPPIFSPATSAPAPAPLVPAAPAPPASPPAAAPAAPAIRTEQTPAALPAVPRLVEPPALPPLSQVAPPLSADSRG